MSASTIGVSPTHSRLDDFLKYLRAINDAEIRDLVLPFEGVTTVAGVAPATINYAVPDDRHLYLYEVWSHVQPEVAGGAQNPDLSSLVTVQCVINTDQQLFNGTVRLAALSGSDRLPLDRLAFKFPYHIRPRVTMAVTFATLVGFPAAVRALGLYFNAVLVKNPLSGM